MLRERPLVLLAFEGHDDLFRPELVGQNHDPAVSAFLAEHNEGRAKLHVRFPKMEDFLHVAFDQGALINHGAKK